MVLNYYTIKPKTKNLYKPKLSSPRLNSYFIKYQNISLGKLLRLRYTPCVTYWNLDRLSGSDVEIRVIIFSFPVLHVPDPAGYPGNSYVFIKKFAQPWLNWVLGLNDGPVNWYGKKENISNNLKIDIIWCIPSEINNYNKLNKFLLQT